MVNKLDSCGEGCSKRRIIWPALGLFLVITSAMVALIENLVEIWVNEDADEIALFESGFDDEMPENSGGSYGFNPRVVLEAQEPIDDPEALPGISISSELLRGNDLVLGISIGDEARAYPVNMLTGPDREIVNDRLGGKRIAATW